MTAAHIFYIPVILMVGLLAGYFLGQRAAEEELVQRRKKLARRRALREKNNESSPATDPAESTNESSP